MVDDEPHVVGVCGSRRNEDSVTRIALGHVAAGVEDSGGTFELIDLDEYDLPPLDANRKDAGDGPELRERLGRADAVALGTPVYHASFSGVLKNALDYCGFDEFEDTTVGLLAVAGGGFPVSALDHLRVVCRSLNAWVVPHQVAIPNSHEATTDGELAEDELAERCETLGEKLVGFNTIRPAMRSFESRENEGA